MTYRFLVTYKEGMVPSDRYFTTWWNDLPDSYFELNLKQTHPSKIKVWYIEHEENFQSILWFLSEMN